MFGSFNVNGLSGLSKGFQKLKEDVQTSVVSKGHSSLAEGLQIFTDGFQGLSNTLGKSQGDAWGFNEDLAGLSLTPAQQPAPAAAKVVHEEQDLVVEDVPDVATVPVFEQVASLDSAVAKQAARAALLAGVVENGTSETDVDGLNEATSGALMQPSFGDLTSPGLGSSPLDQRSGFVRESSPPAPAHSVTQSGASLAADAPARQASLEAQAVTASLTVEAEASPVQGQPAATSLRPPIPPPAQNAALPSGDFLEQEHVPETESRSSPAVVGVLGDVTSSAHEVHAVLDVGGVTGRQDGVEEGRGRVVGEVAGSKALEVAEQSELAHKLSGGGFCPSVLDAGDLSGLEAAALRDLVVSLREALLARESQLERKFEELANVKEVAEQLQARNEELAKRSAKISEEDLEQMREEFEDRLAAAERKVYALTKERDALRRGSEKLTSANELLKAKDDMIKEVMEEGERLSKKQLAQENTIRKLRTQVKDLEAECEKLTAKASSESARAESLRKEKGSLEVQIMAMLEQHSMQLESERRHMREQLATAQAAQSAAQRQLASAAQEDLYRQLREAEARERLLTDSVQQLQDALEVQRAQANRREDVLQAEVSALEQRWQAAEARHEELALKLPETTQPLIRQIQALQAASCSQSAAWAEAERVMVERVREAEAQAAAASEREQVAQERLTAAQSSTVAVQVALEAAKEDVRRMVREVEAAKQAQGEAESACGQLEAAAAAAGAEVQRAWAERQALEHTMEAQLEALQAQNSLLNRKVRDLETQVVGSMRSGGVMARGQPPILTAPGYQWVLLPDKQAVNGGSHLYEAGSPQQQHWPDTQESVGSVNGVYGSGESESAAVLAEMRPPPQQMAALQAQVVELEATRDRLSEDLLALAQRVEAGEHAASQLAAAHAELAGMRQRYQTAMELLGEREEKLEELKADLDDLKAMMKAQVMFMVDHLEKSPSGTLAEMGSYELR